jgi:hypothetical protein
MHRALPRGDGGAVARDGLAKLAVRDVGRAERPVGRARERDIADRLGDRERAAARLDGVIGESHDA